MAAECWTRGLESALTDCEPSLSSELTKCHPAGHGEDQTLERKEDEQIKARPTPRTSLSSSLTLPLLAFPFDWWG